MTFVKESFCFIQSSLQIIYRRIHRSTAMAKSKFDYVRSFEMEDKLDPIHWIVLHIYCSEHKQFLAAQGISSMSDTRFINVMSFAAKDVMKEFNEISLSYGYSNNFHFIFKKDTLLYKRRASKLLSTVSSYFSSSFTCKWMKEVPTNSELCLPVFEGSIYLLPQNQILQEYLVKEQYDCHLNNLEETTVRYLIEKAKYSPTEAAKTVKESSVSEKNEILFSLCNINYNNEPPKTKKGSILLSKGIEGTTAISECEVNENTILEIHEDFYKMDFWQTYFPLENLTKCSKIGLNLFKRTSKILPHTWLVVRIDGKAFHKFSEKHNFVKPNDVRALCLMNSCAKLVMKQFPNIIIAYGQSDEYSFVLRRYNHREKDGYALISRIVSTFGSAYVKLWESEFKDQPLMYAPAFDSRVVLYPTTSSLRDYLSWRQADCHINNMYNLCFWKLVEVKGLSRRDAQKYLKGTFSKDKLVILQNELNIDYKEENAFFRKGTVIYVTASSPKPFEGNAGEVKLVAEHTDIINEDFWLRKPWLLGTKFKAKNDDPDLLL